MGILNTALEVCKNKSQSELSALLSDAVTVMYSDVAVLCAIDGLNITKPDPYYIMSYSIMIRWIFGVVCALGNFGVDPLESMKCSDIIDLM